MNKIHNTAIIGKNTTIGSNVEIGPYCVVEDGVKIGNNNTLNASVYMSGETDIGNGNTFFPFCSIGSKPQDLKYQGEKSKLIIGDKNIFREHSTANPGTSGDNMKTVIGNSSLFMIGAHIAHDCIIGDKVIMANQATLGGHVQVDNFAVLGGLSAVHQFCRIGKLAMVGGLSAVENDVIPFGLALGNRAKITGVNIVGLKRANYSKSSIREYSNIVDKVFTGETITSEKEKIKNSNNDLIKELLIFLDKSSSRGLCQYGK
jgi:UDP-N-acetylglucosamine acyltransferase|tara:strand:+ start:50 stop:829 length:780 start_codon:yes stop_codon:yes gene_type:complete